MGISSSFGRPAAPIIVPLWGVFPAPPAPPPPQRGRGTPPAPFALFLTSIATCAGIYVLRFCQERGLPTEGLRLVQRSIPDPATGLIGRIELELGVTAGVPERYRPA